MTTRIGLISDIHACAAPLEEALAIFRRDGVDMILCAGDIAGYGSELDETVELLKQSESISIMGNHESWYLDTAPEDMVGEYFAQLPGIWESVIEGIQIYAVHASPPVSINSGIRLLDENGRILLNEKERWESQLKDFPFDVLVVGHTHQVFVENLGGTLVINPGSTKFNNTCAILSLPDMGVKIFPLSGKEPLKSWNWGMMARG